MRIVRVAFLGATLFVILFVPPRVASHPTFEYRLNVVALHGEASGGTGFRTKEGTIVSAAHVAQQERMLAWGTAGAFVSADVVCKDEDRDFSLLATAARVSILHLSNEVARPGDAVTIAGFLSTSDFIEVHGHVLRHMTMVTAMHPITKKVRMIGPVFSLYHGRGNLGGLSGSPVVLERTKQVIGMAVAYNEVFGISMAIPVLSVTGECRYP